MTDPMSSGGANQPHGDNPGVPPSQADSDNTPSAAQTPDDPTDGTGSVAVADGPGVGAPEGTVPDVQPVPGTTEAADPVEGTHTPDVGKGGDQLDTASHPTPGRAGGAT